MKKFNVRKIAVPVLILFSLAVEAKNPLYFALKDSGEVPFVDFEHYGRFENVGTHDFRFSVTDELGLSAAVGTGVYPNVLGLRKQKNFSKFIESDLLKGPLEDFYPEKDPEAAFYKWGTLKDPSNRGLKFYNMARSLELGGHPAQALKGYYSTFVNFPKEVVWKKNQPLYIGMAALDAVFKLLEQHPEWKLDLEGADILIENGFDNKTTNDVFAISPGKWVHKAGRKSDPMELKGVQKRVGGRSVHLVQYKNGHWQLMVGGRPFFIRGMCYLPNPIGVSPDWGYRVNSEWMISDQNSNGLIDGPYDAWVDANHNNIQEGNEMPIGDFQLMKEMGINTLRLYHHSENKTLLRDLKRRFGIGVIMGDFLGAYTIGSDAAWEKGTDYTDPAQLEKMRQSVRDMVLENKDEDYVLMWMLGNENNYGNANNANKVPEEFFRFADSVAQMIRDLDPQHPIALCAGDLGNLNLISQWCPNIDVLGVNSYRGSHGFGRNFWRSLKQYWKKPVLISEFGCPAWVKFGEDSEGGRKQAEYLMAAWKDIMNHSAGFETGLAIGGSIFEWIDEWWKAGPQFGVWIHDTEPQDEGPFPDGFMYEEWLGITSQGNGDNSPFMRQLRPAYETFKRGPWRDPLPFEPMKMKEGAPK